MIISRIIRFLLLALLFGACNREVNNELDLSGDWSFRIDSLDQGISEKWFEKEFSETVKLPGSLADNGKGRKVDHATQWLGTIKNKEWYTDPDYRPYLNDSVFRFPYWLIPELHYYGAAWFQKTVNIPNDWQGKSIRLYLERCHWETKVWVNQTEVGYNNALGTPHEYDLSGFLSPGAHTLTIRVDNRMKAVNIGPDAHSVSDHTQGNWNGITGELKLIKSDAVNIARIKCYPDVEHKKVVVVLNVDNQTNKTQQATINLQANLKSTNEPAHQGHFKAKINPGLQTQKYEIDMGVDVKLWDEFTPNLYTLKAQVAGEGFNSQKETTFGMREIKVVDKQIKINNRPVYFRGTLECAIFPKTGYPPTEVGEWKRIIEICKAHGLNHMRFHSWCPPEAAFMAADELGFYLQAESSAWPVMGGASVGADKPFDNWIYEETDRIIEAYGNHPSFCLMTHGNEPSGRNHRKFLGEWVTHYKQKDDRRLYTAGAGWPVIEVNDFHNTANNVRIQGWGQSLNSIINREAPRSDYDWREATQKLATPIIAHEIGQWCAYPNFKEIDKYDGHLKATNFELFQKSLEAHHMGHLADSFLLASGKLQALCYKADIEAALRTPGFGGFQLLDLHDFPGQGTALVGVLDVFWDEKGYITADDYSRFCNQTVPLVRFPKHIYQSAEAISLDVEVTHYGKVALKQVVPQWSIKNTKGEILQSGHLDAINIPLTSAYPLGSISTSIETDKAIQLNLEVSINGYANDWDFWVYPNKPQLESDLVLVVQQLNTKAIEALQNGGKVLLTSKKGSVKPEYGGDIGIGFSSIFWNTAWATDQKPTTLGILCDPMHAAFNDFPTEYHSNWQWWDAMSHSDAISLEDLSSDVQPIVRVIDDWVKNRRLALVFEANAGGGHLMVSGVDLVSNLAERPEARQMRSSLVKYMESDQFKPVAELELTDILELYK
ncbi:sugar-binding domain-containing protein [Carboxylicivirga taeanensis]|uniref:sugar-binding domain-containing protein n=1 Tax=Carboxylicivirga taeanensis TaxID=1416875 RepID=UPI003F6DAB03